jgi:AcrR family transcriptional regulator
VSTASLKHAAVSRGSFYNNFESKEQLIHTYLLGRHERTTTRLSEADPDQVLASSGNNT